MTMRTGQAPTDRFGYLRTSVRAHLSYRANLVGYVLVTGLTYLIRFVFLDRVVEIGGNGLGGWTREQVVDFFYVGLLVGLLSWAFAASVNEFFRHVQLGRIEAHMVRPVGLGQLLLVRWVNSANLAMAVPVLLVVALDRGGAYLAAGPLRLAGYLLSLVLAVVGVLAAVVLMHSLTFVLQRQVPVDYVLSEMFRFATVPSSAFRGWALAAAALAAPIVLGVWAPVAALSGDWVPFCFLFGLSLLLSGLAAWLMSAAWQRFDGLGG